MLGLVSHNPTMMPLCLFLKYEATVLGLRLLRLEGGDICCIMSEQLRDPIVHSSWHPGGREVG